MTELIARRVVDAHARGGFDEIMRALGVAPTTATSYLYRARHVLGVKAARTKNKLAGIPDIDFELVAKLWGEGKANHEIDALTGQCQSVARARHKLGIDRIPSHAVKKSPPKTSTLIGCRDIGRHYVRRLGPSEYIIRGEQFREELWRDDPHGICFRHGLRLSFVIVMGMTERRVPDDLRHIYHE